MDDEQIVDDAGADVELVDDGMGGRVPAPVADTESPADPWAGVPEDVREDIERSGFKNVGDLAKSYKELRREFTQQRQQESRYQREPEQEPRQQQAPPPSQQFSISDYMDAANGDEIVAMELMRQTMAREFEEKMEARFNQFAQERLEPLSQIVGGQYWQNEVRSLQAEYPDEFNKYRGDVEQKFIDDPSLAERQDGMRIAFKLVMGEKAMANQARSRAQQINSGGRGGGRKTDVDPAEAVRQAIRGAQGFGGDRNIG